MRVEWTRSKSKSRSLIEAAASFWASAYKELVVFALIIPVLLWRSLHARPVEEDE